MTTADAIEQESASSGAAGRPVPPRGLLRRGPGRLGGLLLCVAVAAAVGVLSLAVGSRTVPLDATLGALTSYDASDQAQLIVREVRGPRTLIGLMGGVSLGLAGAVMQGVTRNPLAEPGIPGVNAGAALAAAVAVTVLGIGGLLGYIWFAFAGAGIAAVLVFAIGSLGRDGATPVKLAKGVEQARTGLAS